MIQQSNFSLSESDIGSKTLHVYCCIDASDSMKHCWQSLMEELKKFLLRLSKRWKGTYTIKFSIEFFQENILALVWKSSFEEIPFENNIVTPHGSSAIYLALNRSLDILEFPENTLSIFISDGHPNRGSQKELSSLEIRLNQLHIPTGSDFFFLGEHIPIDLREYKIHIKGMYRYEALQKDIEIAFREVEYSISKNFSDKP